MTARVAIRKGTVFQRPANPQLHSITLYLTRRSFKQTTIQAATTLPSSLPPRVRKEPINDHSRRPVFWESQFWVKIHDSNSCSDSLEAHTAKQANDSAGRHSWPSCQTADMRAIRMACQLPSLHLARMERCVPRPEMAVVADQQHFSWVPHIFQFIIKYEGHYGTVHQFVLL